MPADIKTPEEYLENLEEPRKSQIETLHNLIRQTLPQFEPYIQSGMLGYGKYHYKYKTGREGDWSTIALASNKTGISLYVAVVKDGKYVAENYKEKLPKASIGKSCIRFKKIGDVNLETIREILQEAATGSPVIE
jgi:hypothetical protein